MNFINFNEHILASKRNVYGGSDRKRTVILDNNQQYLLKFPDPTRELNRDVSYINNAISEYLGCCVFRQAGFKVQDTIFGVFTDDNGKEKVACACGDFRGAGWTLLETGILALEFLDQKSNLTFGFIRTLIDSLEGIDKGAVFREYCSRFIIDAFIGNTDRHNGNWGFMENGSIFKLAPVYDCGSSFSPLFSDDELSERLASNEALNVMSAILDDNGKRINYRDYLMSGENQDVNIALTEVVPRINIKAIHEMIDEIPYISDVRKNFYKQLIDIRYEKVLIPALENVLGIGKSLEYKQWNSKVIDYIYTNYILIFQSTSTTGEIRYPAGIQGTQSFKFWKNSNIVLFLDETNRCVGLAMLDKSNLNVCKFVQSARKMGFAINIKSIKTELKLQF